jgi:hypothetical protein
MLRVWCYHPMLSSAVITQCFRPMLSSNVIISCYHPGDNNFNFYYSWKLDSLTLGWVYFHTKKIILSFSFHKKFFVFDKSLRICKILCKKIMFSEKYFVFARKVFPFLQTVIFCKFFVKRGNFRLTLLKAMLTSNSLNKNYNK